MKKLYTLRRTLSATVLLMMSALTWAYDFEVDGIYYNINYDGKSVEVTDKNKDNGDGGYSGFVDIPSTVTYKNKTYSVTSIGYGAFWGSSLTSISIPESVTSIGSYAFFRCSSLTSISIPEGVTSIGRETFYDCSSLTSISIPEGVTSIGDYAFQNCSSLTSISIPESVTSIEDWVFYGCSSLTSISIPENVTRIGVGAFSNCRSLTSITVSANNPVYDSREGCNAIIKTSSNTLITGCQNTIIPEGVTSIGDGAFSNYSSLTSISIPESVTSIGSSAFSNCSSLTSISIPESVTSIGSFAFYQCSSLTSISLPESVTSIGYYAFQFCYSLTSISIPEGVTSIEQSTFENCSSLTSVICYAEKVPKLESDVFYNVPTSEATLYVPASALADYKAAYGWKDFGTILPLEDIPAGISNIKADETNAPYYTLDGKRVDTPTQKGIYIRNGKKVLVK